MRLPRIRLRTALLAALAIVPWLAMPLLYWLGYRAGYTAAQRDPWAIVKPRRGPNGKVNGSSYDWFDLSNPEDVPRLKAEEARLKTAGIEYYLAKGRRETSITIDPDPASTRK